MSTPANFDGAKPSIDPEDSLILLIDHQSGLFQLVEDLPRAELRNNVTTLAKVATLAKIPVITTASVPQGPNGPLMPEIRHYAPHARHVPRRGEIDAWDNPDFVAAVKATGRRTLLIAGILTSVCVAFPSLSAVQDGYKVFAVIDASGTYSELASKTTLARLVQAGVVPIDLGGVIAELQKTWNRPDAQQWAEVYAAAFPPYRLLIESWQKAQEQVKQQDQPESPRK